jgi:hypothetical protein
LNKGEAIAVVYIRDNDILERNENGKKRTESRCI